MKTEPEKLKADEIIEKLQVVLDMYDVHLVATLKVDERGIFPQVVIKKNPPKDAKLS